MASMSTLDVGTRVRFWQLPDCTLPVLRGRVVCRAASCEGVPCWLVQWADGSTSTVAASNVVRDSRA